jgi:thiamine-phosphate pyrophosphorylase
VLLYYITDRVQFPGSEARRRELIIERTVEAARAGIDYIQVREKTLSSRELEEMARVIVQRVREAGSATRVLINSRTDVALAVGADGVHLRSSDVSPADVRRIWSAAGAGSKPVVAVSCHTEQEVTAAELAGADFVVFGPVFGKSGTPGVGLPELRATCAHGIPVFALGGVSLENYQSCLEVGAAGVAGIRLFQDGNLSAALTQLRKVSPSR